MKRILCNKCGRFLLEMSYGEIEIQCPNSKCKHINKIKAVSHKHLLSLTSEQEQAIIKA